MSSGENSAPDSALISLSARYFKQLVSEFALYTSVAVASSGTEKADLVIHQGFVHMIVKFGRSGIKEEKLILDLAIRLKKR